MAIPAGYFKQGKKGHLKFEGKVNGVELEATITPLGGNQFAFEVEGEGANLEASEPRDGDACHRHRWWHDQRDRRIREGPPAGAGLARFSVCLWRGPFRLR